MPTTTARQPALSPWATDPDALRAIAAIRARNPIADPLAALPDVHPGRLPRHVAIIMDGNGRWATQRGFPREFGHRAGVASVRAVVEEAQRLGLECLTLYSFSLENWKRPPREVAALMDLAVAYIEGEAQAMIDKGLRFRVIGRREGLPAPVLEAIDRVTEATRGNTRGTLCLAMNYGSRAEIADAARAIARKVRAGTLDPECVDEACLTDHLYAPDLPDPDLLVRTAGEMRLSNYLLWQLSYAEIYVTPTPWPDFGVPAFHEAIRAFASRQRRFGGVDEEPGVPAPADAPLVSPPRAPHDGLSR